MTELWHDDYYRLSIDGSSHLRLVRTAVPYPSLASMDEANRALAVAIRNAGVRRVLLDLRGGPPGRNDEAFEHAGESWRRQLAAQCDRVAILVRTVAGKLQAQRLARSEGRSGTAAVFMDEAEALAHLR